MFKTKKNKSSYIRRAAEFANEIKEGMSKESKAENQKAKDLMKALFS